MTPAALMALAVWLAVGPPGGAGVRRLGPGADRGRRLPPVAVPVAGAAVLVWVVLGGGAARWVLMAGIAAATGGWLARRAARARRIDAGQREVARAAGTLSLLLASGWIPSRAIREAAEDSPCLGGAAAAVRLGGHACSALIEDASTPGWGGLAAVAAAWQVSEQCGAPIAGVMSEVADSLRQERRLADVVTTELAAARASGRIMAFLPVVAVGLGSAVGADPVAFLVGDGIGPWFLLVGVGLSAAGLIWTELIAGGSAPAGSETGRPG